MIPSESWLEEKKKNKNNEVENAKKIENENLYSLLVHGTPSSTIHKTSYVSEV